MGIIRDVSGPYDPVLGGTKIEETPCFYCGKPMSVPGIIWVGNDVQVERAYKLILHPACVIELFLRLGRDVWEIECKTNLGLRMISRME